MLTSALRAAIAAPSRISQGASLLLSSSASLLSAASAAAWRYLLRLDGRGANRGFSAAGMSSLSLQKRSLNKRHLSGNDDKNALSVAAVAAASSGGGGKAVNTVGNAMVGSDCPAATLTASGGGGGGGCQYRGGEREGRHRRWIGGRHESPALGRRQMQMRRRRMRRRTFDWRKSENRQRDRSGLLP